MKLTILPDQSGTGGFAVWAGLEGSDPQADAFGFIVGLGETRAEAASDAELNIQTAVTEMFHLEAVRRAD